MICPRCAGRLYEGEDYAGRFRSCINCGYLAPLDRFDPTGTPPLTRVSKGGRKAALRGMTTGQRHPRA